MCEQPKLVQLILGSMNQGLNVSGLFHHMDSDQDDVTAE